MNIQNKQKSESALLQILEWSIKRPDWQRDALRRIVLNGKLEKQDITEISELCKKENGENSISATPKFLGNMDIPIGRNSSETIYLTSMSQVTGVNMLAPNQTMEFEPKGITIIYGRNGTGKTGYTRVLKKACVSRLADEILQNVHGSDSDDPATAQLSILTINGDSKTIKWVDEETWSEQLSTITVFDNKSATVHVKDKNEVWFRPFGLDIPDELAKLCDELKKRFTYEQKILTEQQESIFKQPNWDSNSEIGIFMSNLSPKVDLNKINLNLSFNKEDEARLEKLKVDLRDDPKTVAKNQQDYASSLNQVVSYISNIQKILGLDAQKKLQKLIENAKISREAANLAAKKAFSNLELEGVGGETWKKLWDAAREYSESFSNDKLSFPPKPKAKCVLCHQIIDERTAKRMAGFEEFIKQNTEASAEVSEASVKDAVDKIKELPIHFAKISVGLSLLKNNNPQLASQICKSIAFARIFRCRMLKNIVAGELELSELKFDNVIGTTIEERKSALTYATALMSSQDSETWNALINELANLKDRKQSKFLMEVAENEIQRLKKLLVIENCLNAVKTNPITKFANELADKIITPKIKKRFEEEIKKLANKNVRVEINRSGGGAGSPRYQVNFFGNVAAKVPNILSEGELKSVALAAYLTELETATHSSGLIFDDPVSSLDHIWRKGVATRLIEESKIRQIIVFSHDIVFVNDLLQSIHKEQIKYKLLYLSRQKDVVGIINDGIPWDVQSVDERIKFLKCSHAKLKKHYSINNEKYRLDVGKFYNQFRATLERIIEEVIFAGVVVRHRDYIVRRELIKVTAFNNNDYEAFDKFYIKCNELVDAHDSSLGRIAEPPCPNEIWDDIKNLKTWLEKLRKRMNSAKNHTNKIKGDREKQSIT